MNSKTKYKIIASLFVVVLLFVAVSVLVQQHIGFFRDLITRHYFLGMFVFVFLEVLAIVVAPITSLPLLPIASNTYGVLLTSLLFIVGGIIGSLAAFIIGRKFRKKLLGRVVSLKDAEMIEAAIPRRHYFWTLVLMRIVVPSDILSYTLGIATSVNFSLFVRSTLIGIIPSAFFFSYLGVLPLKYQVLGWIFGVVVLFLILRFLFGREKLNTHDKSFQNINLSF